jgi:phosphoenolpyruvate---glycerone phosphotransferase subunit DhaL
MGATLSAADLRAMLVAAAARVVASVDLLTALDQAIGDGDHGIGMRRGFAAVQEQLAVDHGESADVLLKGVGTTLMSKTGGAAGAVFGTFFRAGAEAVAGHALDGATFAAFLRRGAEAVMQRGGAKPGQKTMLDAAVPAADAAAAAPDLRAALAAAAQAAEAGVEATKDMLATTGKARTLGERALGHVDPGAMTFSLILLALRDAAPA